MRSVMLAVVILTLAIGMTACAAGTPVAAPSNEAVPALTSAVAAAEAATALPAATATVLASPSQRLGTCHSCTGCHHGANRHNHIGGGSRQHGGRPSASRARALAKSCAGCHGAQGQGGGAPAVVGSSANLLSTRRGKDCTIMCIRGCPCVRPEASRMSNTCRWLSICWCGTTWWLPKPQ